MRDSLERVITKGPAVEARSLLRFQFSWAKFPMRHFHTENVATSVAPATRSQLYSPRPPQKTQFTQVQLFCNNKRTKKTDSK